MNYATKASTVTTYVLGLLPELDVGGVEAALGVALSAAAAGSVNTGRKSLVTLTMEMRTDRSNASGAHDPHGCI